MSLPGFDPGAFERLFGPAGKLPDQKEQVYAAERECRIVYHGGRFGYRRASEYLQWVLTKREVQEQYGVWQVVLDVLEPRLNGEEEYGAACAGLAPNRERTGWIRIPAAGVTQGLLVHELAHCFADARGASGHDGTWVTVYLQLVRLLFGQQREQRLRAAFKRHGVQPVAGN